MLIHKNIEYDFEADPVYKIEVIPLGQYINEIINDFDKNSKYKPRKMCLLITENFTDAIRHMEYRVDGYRHHPTQPATIAFSNGKKVYESWFKHGKLHRENGPAYFNYNSGDLKWVLNGEYVYPDYKHWPLTKKQQIEFKLRYG